MSYYRCTCGKEFAKRAKNLAVAHWRKAHPDDAYGCWDQIGDIGDQFATQVIDRMHEKLIEQSKRADEAEVKAKAYDALLPRFIALGRACRISRDAIEAATDFESMATKEKR